MNIVKRFVGNNHDENGGAALGQHTPQTMTPFTRNIESVFDRIWQDFNRDFWSAWGLDPSMSAAPGAAASGAAIDWPAMDVSEDENGLTLRFDVPGLEEKDLRVELSGNTLTVSGSRTEEHEDTKHHRRERLSGSFMRSVMLPEYVDTSSIDAGYKNGVLTVTARKDPEKGPRKIQVKI